METTPSLGTRWGRGSLEYIPQMFKLRVRRMWPVMIEALVSIIWSYVMIMIFTLFFVGLFVDLPLQWQIKTLMPQWYGVILGGTCLIQFLVSLWIDQRYDRGRFLEIISGLFGTRYFLVTYFIYKCCRGTKNFI